MKGILQIMNGIALLITIAINYLANTRLFNDTTVGEVSDKYNTFFTPAGYAFSIWGLIYLLLLGFVGYQAKSLLAKKEDDDVSDRIGAWFVISCIANCTWLMTWLYEYTGLSVLIMLVMLFSLLMMIIRLNLHRQPVSFQKKVFVVWPVSVYAGWISVALIANTAVWLTKTGWNGFNIPGTNWTIVMVIVASLLNCYIIFKRNMHAFALTGSWAFVAIAVANQHEARAITWVSLLAAALLVIACGFNFLMKRRHFKIMA